MGAVYDFEKEKLIIGVIYSDEKLLNNALEILTEEFGEIDAVSEEFSFSLHSSPKCTRQISSSHHLRTASGFDSTVRVVITFGSR